MTLKGDKGQTGLIVSSRAYWFFPHSYFYTPPSHSFPSALSPHIFLSLPFSLFSSFFQTKFLLINLSVTPLLNFPCFFDRFWVGEETQPQSNLRSWLVSFQNNSGTDPQKTLPRFSQTRDIVEQPNLLSQVTILLHLTSLLWPCSVYNTNKSLNVKTY